MTTLTTNLVSYWKLDETSGTTASDELGSYNGTNSNITLDEPGKIGRAYSFNGTSSEVNCGSIPLNNRDFSISMWIKNTKSTTNNSYIVGLHSASSTRNSLHIGRRGSNGKFTIAFFGDDMDSATSVTTDGTWQHWVVTYNHTTRARKIYLNGSQDASGTAGGSLTATGTFRLGRWETDANAWFSGIADEIGVWHKELSASEVEELYNSNSGLTYPFVFGIHSLNITKRGLGASGGIITLNPNKELYEDNEEVEITASVTDEELYRFYQWQGDLTGNTNPETITMDENKQIDAFFQKWTKVFDGVVF